MTKSWTIFEKITGILQIIFGLVLIYILIWAINIKLNQVFKITGSDISFFKIFYTHHYNFILSLLGIVSGVLLIRNNKIGWILSISTWFSYSIGTIFTTWKIALGNSNFEIYSGHYIIYGLMIIIFLIMGILLISKEFRKKYSPNRKSWVLLILITAFFILDRLILI